MIRHLLALWVLLASALACPAQDLSALARVDLARSGVQDTGAGLRVDLRLSQGVPYRAYTLADPPRLVLDFREVLWDGMRREALLNADRALDLRFGPLRPGWSRLVVDLSGPLAIDRAGLRIDEATGAADLRVDLEQVSEAAFLARSGVPGAGPGWGAAAPPKITAPRLRQDGRRGLTIVLDPGHGGIDPGAERDGESEARLMLRFAKELEELLLRQSDHRVELTRRDDIFVPLEARVAFAHERGADLFLSLHADALADGIARGATVYTLSEEASDVASAKLAERHDRADLLAGVDLNRQDDEVALVLMDLARIETAPRSERLARSIVTGLKTHLGRINNRPYRQAGFSVLKAADIPSVLVELGFMSDARDLANLRDPAWRAKAAQGLADAISAWAIEDAAEARLLRQ